MTHVVIDGKEPERDRSILDPCEWCNARAGEPCITEGLYYCIAENCEQGYKSANDALNCMMHTEISA